MASEITFFLKKFLILFHIWVAPHAISKSTRDPVTNVSPALAVSQFSFLGFWLSQLNFSVFTSFFQGGLQRKSLASRRAAALLTPLCTPHVQPQQVVQQLRMDLEMEDNGRYKERKQGLTGWGDRDGDKKTEKRRKDWLARCKHFQSSPHLIFQHEHSCGGVLFACNRQVMSGRNSVALT